MQQNKLNIQTETAPDFSGLKAAGYTIPELFLDGYFDGFSATKTVKDKTVEVYVGSDDGNLYFTPQAYVGDSHIGEAATPEKAARMAEIGALFRAQNLMLLCAMPSSIPHENPNSHDCEVGALDAPDSIPSGSHISAFYLAGISCASSTQRTKNTGFAVPIIEWRI